MPSAKKSMEFQLVLVKQDSPATAINVSTSMNVHSQVHLHVNHVETHQAATSVLVNQDSVVMDAHVETTTNVQMEVMTVIQTLHVETIRDHIRVRVTPGFVVAVDTVMI